jgi:hypothetical protein
MNGQLGIDGQVQPERICICGCKRSLAGKRTDALWFSRACAVRWARENPGKSLYAGHSANKGRTKKVRRPCERGVQLSYYRAVTELAADYVMRGASQRFALRRAERVLRRAVPDAQLVILAAREQREETT